MREILFKGKRIDNGQWVKGSFVSYSDYDGNKVYLIFASNGNPNTVDPETISECTYLTDKNGTKIFEGDIVESRASENREDWKRWLVVFFDGSFCFEREIPKGRKRKHEQNLLCGDNVELYGLVVIGNIHDNPELLKGGAE